MRKTTLSILLALGCAAAPPACSPSQNTEAERQNGGSTKSQAPAVAPVYDGARAWKDLERIVGYGPRPTGSPALEELRLFLEAELKEVGLEPKRETFEAEVPRTSFTPEGKLTFTNLYVDMPAHGNPEAPIVMVASHMDTKFMEDFMGANDAGSSTAAVLELARALQASSPRKVQYRFIFFDGEEAVREFWQDPDNTYGSRHHAHEFSKKRDFERLKAFVLLDMVGDKDLKLSPDQNSTPWLRKLFDKAIEKGGYGKHLGARTQTISDDHIPFRKLNIPVLDLIDFEYGGPQNPYWHT
ncbi:MAG: M28 family peptidase, partial [Planctomycetes bacterium]|nr:M28 family peptidase [Planctomycetota bacterium]